MATPTKNRFESIWQTTALYGAYFIFAVAGSLASLACMIPAVLFRGACGRGFGQKLIRALFRIFNGYLRATGLVKLDAGELGELSQLRDARGLIVVANHPSLLDAVLLVSLLPRAVCLMKGSLARNIIFSGTARLAGYVHNQSGLGLIKKCGQRLNEGANLLVFPEGTRSVGGQLLPFKMGFALAAVATGSPVQTVIIRAESNYLGKGVPLFQRPVFPLRYSFRLGRRFQPEPGGDAKQFGGIVENYFREQLSPAAENPPAPAHRP